MNEGTQNNGRNPEELERDIDRTRSSLGRTIDELENRLSPGQLLDQALGMARQHGGEFATNLGRSAENNPVPLLLTAVGIAWMMASSNEPRADKHEVSGRASGAKERVQSGVESARSAAGAVSDRAHRAKDTVGQAGERIRTQSQRMKQGFARLMEEQPLLVGAMGIAVGAALGATLPRSEAEDRMLGDTSDSAARSIKDRASETLDEVKDKAAEIAPSREQLEREHPEGERPAMQSDFEGETAVEDARARAYEESRTPPR
jgi:ElaB/YqjD/DUF883 family membrane-anchored ribosome-binding protein